MEYLLTGTEMAACDRRTSEEIGIPSLVLMERAALSVADGVDDWLKTHSSRRPVVLAAAGRGNNGADSLAAGRILLERGYEVCFYRLSGEVSPESSFAVQEKILHSFDAAVEVFGESGLPGVPDVIIDGLFGTGLSRPLQGEAAAFVEAINRCHDLGSYVIAVDLPSGISSENGRVMGCAVHCDETRTFAFYKRGHFLYPGAVYAGTCHRSLIGITERAFESAPGMFTFLSERASELLPGRDPGGNKGTFGKVLLVAGRKNMCGAAVLAAKACMAAGAGMVRVFTCESNRLIIQQALPEALLETYEEGDPVSAALLLRRAMEWADLVAAGPAMGTDRCAGYLLKTILEEAGKGTGSGAGGNEVQSRRGIRGLVLDADALRLLAKEEEYRQLLADRREDLPCILTPHLAEFAALAGLSLRECMEERIPLVREQADRLRCTIACKDARTLVTACGRQTGMYLNCSGNSGMATAGSGDVLTGMTAAILTRFLHAEPAAGTFSLPVPFTPADLQSGFAAACCAVYLHGRAGDCARSEHSGEAMTAGDLVSALRTALFWE